MSSEGVAFLLRGLLVLCLVVSGAIVRTFIGPSKRRGHMMLAGMLGGMAFGALVSYSIPSSLRMDESAILAVVGMMLGWCVAWFFARRVPREAN